MISIIGCHVISIKNALEFKLIPLPASFTLANVGPDSVASGAGHPLAIKGTHNLIIIPLKGPLTYALVWKGTRGPVHIRDHLARVTGESQVAPDLPEGT